MKSSTDSHHKSTGHQRSPISKIVKASLFAAYVLLSTLVLFLALEAACYFMGVPQGAGDYIERVILQQNLSLRKPPGQYRIFVYGESTIHGAGYAPASSPVKWLEAYLRDFLPDRDLKVVNFGRLGEESDFIAQSFLDTLQYRPDLAIFYMGHNTFYADNRADFVREREARFINRLRRFLRKSRLVCTLVRESIKFKIRRHAARGVDVMGGAEIETYGDPLKEGDERITVPGSPVYLENIAFFRANVEKILRSGAKSSVPLLFMKPVCNLKDYPPDHSLHLKALTDAELERWSKLYENGKTAVANHDEPSAIGFFEEALTIDPTYADLNFRLGQLYFQQGEIDRAREAFENARDHDTVVRRAPKDILEALAGLTSRDSSPYFLTEKDLLSRAPGAILGWPLIEDNVHFSIEGQALVGRALAYEIAQNGWIAPRREWQFDRERPMTEIEKELGITPRTVFLNYGSVIGYLGPRYEERLLFSKRASELFPEDPVAMRQLAWSYWLLERKEEALRVYKQLEEKDPAALKAVFAARPEIRQAYEAAAQPPANP